MKILVLNGSPKADKSDTMVVTNAFIEGLNNSLSNEVDIINVAEKKINDCLGCYACWGKTNGVCVQKDDMKDIFDKYVKADMVIWSFPLYYFSMPAIIKAVMDRTLPSFYPSMINVDGRITHPCRYDLSKTKYVLISGCGFPDVEGNFDALIKQFEILYKKQLTAICVPEAPMLQNKQAQIIVKPFLEKVKKAGEEFGKNGEISKYTKSSLNSPMLLPSMYMQIINGYWKPLTDKSEKE